MGLLATELLGGIALLSRRIGAGGDNRDVRGGSDAALKSAALRLNLLLRMDSAAFIA
jgi:hypothetical protein